MNKGKLDKFPDITERLLKALDEAYPERCPSTDLTHQEMCRRTGQREVVRFLHEIYKQQQERKYL